MSDETQSKPKRDPFNMRAIAGAVVVSIILVVGALILGGPILADLFDPCSANAVKEPYNDFNEVMRHFDDVNNIANSTARMNLSPMITQLQDVRRDAEDLELPECMNDMRVAAVDYMDSVIQGYVIFLDPDNPDSKLYDQIDIANVKLSVFQRELDRFQNEHMK